MTESEKRAVYAALAEKLRYPLTERFERLLRKTATPLEARLLVASPAAQDELATLIGSTVAEVEAKLRYLAASGRLLPTRKGYFFPRDVAQLHDACLTSEAKYIDKELLDLWDDFFVNEWYARRAQEVVEGPQSLSRCIPHRKALRNEAGVEAFDSVFQIVSSATRWSVVPCSCRLQSHRCDNPLKVCLQMNKSAEFQIERGAGSDLTLEEALAVIDKAEEAGLVHMVINSRSNLSIVCNCCDDCCMLLRPLFEYQPDKVERGFAKSRFEARISEEACTGCQLCVDRCKFGAITMREMAGSRVAKATIDPASCWGCGACVSACLDEAISLTLVRPPEHVPAGIGIH